MPVRSLRWHKRRNAADQLKRGEVQLVSLGTAPITVWFPFLFGVAAHQGGTLFAKALHRKGRTQYRSSRSSVARSYATMHTPASTGKRIRWARICLASKLSSKPLPTKARKIQTRKVVCTWASVVSSIPVAGWKITTPEPFC